MYTPDSSIVDKLEQIGIKALDFGEKTASQAVVFIEREAPLLLNEWLTWNFWISFIPFSIILILIIVLLSFTKKISRYNQTLNYTFIGLPWFGYGCGLVFLSSMSFLYTDWLKIWLAPRLWILENVKELFK